MGSVSIIVARSKNNLIGINNQLPWHHPTDLQHFKETTMNSTVLMGRKTFESLGKKPLPKRVNVVLTKQHEYNVNGCVVINNLNKFIEESEDNKIFIIGGSEIYYSALKDNLVDEIIISEIDEIYKIDEWGDNAYFHPDLSKFRLNYKKKISDKINVVYYKKIKN